MYRFVPFLLSLFLVFGLASGKQNIELPDYSGWEKYLDHSSACLYKGKKVSLTDKHYEDVNPERAKEQVLVVIHHPETGKEWFAFHFIREKGERVNSLKVYLFEKNKEDKWVFVQDVSGGKVDDIFKSRYDLVRIK